MSEPGSPHPAQDSARHARTCFGLVIGALAAACALGCQGGFDPPSLDNPRDPNNTDLPPVPTVTATATGCDDGVPVVRVTWSVSSDPSITGFQVYRSSRENIDPGFLVAATGPSAREFVDGNQPGSSPLLERVPYWYRVRVLGTNGLAGLRSQPDSANTPNCR